MKIILIINNPQSAIEDWNDLQKNNLNTQIYDKDFYEVIKVLENNKQFEKQILDTRKKLQIPEKGYDWGEYIKRSKKSDIQKNTIADKLSKIELKLSEISNIKAKFNLNYMIIDQLENILFANFVYLVPSRIRYEFTPYFQDFYNEGLPDCIVDRRYNIIISSRVSKNELIKYIENNWNQIQKEIDQIPPINRIRIDKRDYRIIQLKDEDKLKFKDIAERIKEEFNLDDPDMKINEDSIKTAYRRAKKRINSFLPKGNS